MYFGTYTFFIIPLLLRMDFIALFVEDEKNEYRSLPVSTYTGNGTPRNAASSRPPLPRSSPNTTLSTIIVSSGSIIVQRIPK